MLTSLDISDVDTVWTWGDKRPPPGSKYFSEIFSLSHIKLTNNNPNKDFKSVEKFSLGRKIFSSEKIKRKF